VIGSLAFFSDNRPHGDGFADNHAGVAIAFSEILLQASVAFSDLQPWKASVLGASQSINWRDG
jgi:hypothetical protein